MTFPTHAELRALPEGALSYVPRADGTRLRCISAGAGPTVVLAHGVLGSITHWNLVGAELRRRGHRVVVFDQRGHGGSSIGADGMTSRAMAGDYAAILEHFDVRDAVLAGHSMGAFLAIVFALHHADVVRARLRGLVLVGGHAGGAAKDSLQNRLQVPLLRTGLMPPIARAPRLGRAFVRTLFGDVAPHAQVEALRRSLEGVEVEPILPMISAMGDEDWYARLGELAAPTRILSGELDRTCRPEHSQRMGAAIRGARTAFLPRVGHMVPYERPQAIVDAVTELLLAEVLAQPVVGVGHAHR